MEKPMSANASVPETSPQLSIVVPIYNVEDWLEESLDSIYSLKGLTYEVILVNDGATDSSPQIVERYAKRFPDHTIVVDKPNGGLSDARNAGLTKASGDYVSFIDSDDFIDPEALKELFEQAVSNELDIAMGTGYEYFSESHQKPLIVNKQALVDLPVSSGTQFLDGSFQNKIFNNVTAWDKLYRRPFLQEHGFVFQVGWLHEDVPFAFDVFTEAKKVKFFDIAFYYYRQRDGSIISRWGERNAVCWIKILNYIHSLLKQKNISISNFDDYLIYQSWQLYTRSGYLDKQLVLKVMVRMNLSLTKLARAFVLLTKKSHRGEA